MNVTRLRLCGFRNYGEAEIFPENGINVISGRNAQGKTNLLEAVGLLSGGKSFRTRFDREMIGFAENGALVEADVISGGREQQVSVLLRRGTKKQITVNGAKRSGTELGETVNTVLFCPDDLNLIRDGAAARRRMMDLAIPQLRPAYAELLSAYAVCYENKMRILRDYREDPSMLDTLPAFSDSLCRLSAQLIRYRASFARRLNESAAEIHREFSGAGEELLVHYTTVSTVTDPEADASVIYAQLLDHLEAHRDAELASASCLTGAHKDDLDITINGLSARTYASQGQARTAALSMKLAEREIFLAETGEYPILLLDDVLSELDPVRREFVLNRIGGGQTLITCCEDEHIAERTGGKVFLVDHGTVLSS